MKSTGIVRGLDPVGRVVLPKEIRDSMNIKDRDSLEIFVNEDTVLLKKFERACIFCGEAKDTIYFKGKHICKKCLNEL